MQLPTLSPRRRLGAAATACIAAMIPVAALAASSLAASSGAGTTAAVPPCATSGLVVWLDTSGNGTAGSVDFGLQFTNLSGHACTLKGYPGVSAVNLAGHRLGSAASRDTTGTPHLVTLARGTTAIALLQIVEADNFSNSACHRVTAAGLRVYPPNQSASKVVPFPFQACSHTGPVYLSVRAVHHG